MDTTETLAVGIWGMCPLLGISGVGRQMGFSFKPVIAFHNRYTNNYLILLTGGQQVATFPLFSWHWEESIFWIPKVILDHFWTLLNTSGKHMLSRTYAFLKTYVFPNLCFLDPENIGCQENIGFLENIGCPEKIFKKTWVFKKTYK